jgi:predicted hydrocarbon binding protein
MNEIERLIEELDRRIAFQENKVLELGRRYVPYATAEDLRNSEDFPQLKDKPMYHFEEGILTGLIEARILLVNTHRKQTQA